MNHLRLILFIGFISFSSVVFGQDTLPKFNVINPGNDHMIISWVNNFDSLKQISIQTSHDSLRNYRTLISVADPNSKQNGFADTKAINDHMYYRLFVVKGDGEYFFTEAKQPILDSSTAITKYRQNFNNNYKRPDFIPSFYVYTNREGYVYINLPDADRKKYRIKFYEEDNDFLFELKNIKETGLTLDKTNFLHSGWFNFELYNDERLIEKNKFYLNREF